MVHAYPLAPESPYSLPRTPKKKTAAPAGPSEWARTITLREWEAHESSDMVVPMAWDALRPRIMELTNLAPTDRLY
jgi:hypothetical protein